MVLPSTHAGGLTDIRPRDKIPPDKIPNLINSSRKIPKGEDVKKLALAVVPLILVACVSNPSQPTASSEVPSHTTAVDVVSDPAAAYRKYQGAKPIPIQPGSFYLRVIQDGNRWMPDAISRTYIMRTSVQQEEFYVSADKGLWGLVVAKYDDPLCDRKNEAAPQPYSVCNSGFGRFSPTSAAFSVLMTLGTSMITTTPKTIDSASVTKAIHSIPEDALNQKLLELAEQDKDAQTKAAAQQAAADAARQKAAAELAKVRASRQALITTDLEAMAKQPRGAEDACKRVDFLHGDGVLIPATPTTVGGFDDPDSGYAQCTLGGLVDIAGLPKAGWIIVNKTRTDSGYVTDYLVRKAR
jgi:hypothetical protein